MEQGTSEFADEGAPTPVRLCQCGCGEPAPLAKWSDKRKGHVRGEPVRFISGHNARGPRKWPAPPREASTETKLCECGCGQPTPLAKTHRPSRGLIKGQPLRFAQGHGGRERRSGRQPNLFVEVGQRIGYGIVLEAEIRIPYSSGRNKTARAARLLCDCGNQYVARIDSLVGTPAKVKSCGCRMLQALAENRGRPEPGRRYRPFIDRTGQRFGRLVVLREVERPVPFGADKVKWLCLCDCGSEAVVETGRLTSGGVKSCGCLMREITLPPGRAGRNMLLGNYRYGARTRGLPWKLTEDDFDRLTSQDCHYCGCPPSSVAANGNSRYVYNGIDRLDSARGYLPGNVVTACGTCNKAKNAMSYDDFLAWIARLTEYHFFHPDVMPSALLRKAAG